MLNHLLNHLLIYVRLIDHLTIVNPVEWISRSLSAQEQSDAAGGGNGHRVAVLAELELRRPWRHAPRPVPGES